MKPVNAPGYGSWYWDDCYNVADSVLVNPNSNSQRAGIWQKDLITWDNEDGEFEKIKTDMSIEERRTFVETLLSLGLIFTD